MNTLLGNLPHLITSTVVIAAVTALAATGTISGNEALVVIAAAGGVSLGASAGGLTAGATPAATVTAQPSPIPPA